MEEEAVIFYCLINGFLDSIEVNKLASFEDSLYQEMKTNEIGKEIANEIRTTKQLPADLDKLNKFIEDFKKRFM